jgi:hypothetical protein
MSDAGVDLSQIRGDWYFHMSFLSNAINNTMVRLQKSWAALKPAVSDAGQIDTSVSQQASVWREIAADVDAEGAVRATNDKVPGFIQLCRDGFAACDALSAAGDPADQVLEEFTEAARQVRGLCDDLEMMREQSPQT